MKILFGVQATGNGHITRARALNSALKKCGVYVDYVFSGRDRADLFDMEEFGDFKCFSGLTFVTDNGSVRPIQTVCKNNLWQLYKDIKALDLSAYDLVVTDFEPITAWAARQQGKMSVAIGHQNAFDFSIPKKGSNPAVRLFMRYFAPAKIRLGLHWHHFGQPILPPIADTSKASLPMIENKVLVYLGFERLDIVVDWLTPVTDHEFFIYASVDKPEDKGHIHIRPLSREGFQQDLANCNGVISNAGFELASEAIHLGKRLLVKPLQGQMEQLSNALALEQLALGMQMKTLDSDKLKAWLYHFEGKQVVYPDVPAALADWLVAGHTSGSYAPVGSLASDLWQAVDSPDIPNFVTTFA